LWVIGAALNGTKQKIGSTKKRHRLSFELAQYAFEDPQRIIAKSIDHDAPEDRFYCFGEVLGRLLQ
jgi:uncharacterized DUF497 family protein